MNSSEAADAVIRLYLQGVELTLRVSGVGAKNFAAMLVAVANSKHKTKGQIRLSNLLKSNKELKIFSVKREDLNTFKKEAKRYGVLYTVIFDKSKDGLIDVMVKSEDAGKINRIVERFKLATVDTLSIKNEITKSLESKKEVANKQLNPKNAMTEKSPLSEHLLGNKKEDSTKKRPSVKKKLNEIKEEMEKKALSKENSKVKTKSKKIKKSSRKER